MHLLVIYLSFSLILELICLLWSRVCLMFLDLSHLLLVLSPLLITLKGIVFVRVFQKVLLLIFRLSALTYSDLFFRFSSCIISNLLDSSPTVSSLLFWFRLEHFQLSKLTVLSDCPLRLTFWG